ncbi:MAG: hypothetical protein DRJ46_01490 [Thermoprotei archaeon]|nr:MAG: hypothetical protein DRJ46_01490 [Thermoprotei archaeon]
MIPKMKKLRLVIGLVLVTLLIAMLLLNKNYEEIAKQKVNAKKESELCQDYGAFYSYQIGNRKKDLSWLAWEEQEEAIERIVNCECENYFFGRLSNVSSTILEVKSCEGTFRYEYNLTAKFEDICLNRRLLENASFVYLIVEDEGTIYSFGDLPAGIKEVPMNTLILRDDRGLRIVNIQSSCSRLADRRLSYRIYLFPTNDSDRVYLFECNGSLGWEYTNDFFTHYTYVIYTTAINYSNWKELRFDIDYDDHANCFCSI